MMADRSHDRDIGALQADMRNTVKMLDSFAHDLKEHTERTQQQFEMLEDRLGKIFNALSEARGGWKTIIAIGAAVGGAVSIGILKISPFFWIMSK